MFNKVEDASSGLSNPEYTRTSRIEVHEVSSEELPTAVISKTLPGGGSVPAYCTAPRTNDQDTTTSCAPKSWVPSWKPKNWLKTCWSSEFILHSEEKSSSKSEPQNNINPSVGFERKMNLTDSSSYTYSEHTLKTKSRTPIYTMHHRIADAIKFGFLAHGLQGSHVAMLVVEFHTIYDWVQAPDAESIQVAMGHDNTIARNSKCEFGVVLGTALDPSVDHVISLRVDDGVEFGLGVCTKDNAQSGPKRDFMCEKGGWGYYNYKSKFVGMKPKYPSGWYKQTHSCMKQYPEDQVLLGGDVLTMTVTREGLNSSYNYSKPARGNGCYTIGFFKNDKNMGCVFHNIKGDLNMCLNYYFMATTVRLLSDHKAPLKQITQCIATA